MIIRIAIIGAAALVLSASSGTAQTRTSKQVVISEPVRKSMVARKSKTKAPLAARFGIVRRSAVTQAKPVEAPTAVREVPPLPKKN